MKLKKKIQQYERKMFKFDIEEQFAARLTQ